MRGEGVGGIQSPFFQIPCNSLRLPFNPLKPPSFSTHGPFHPPNFSAHQTLKPTKRYARWAGGVYALTSRINVFLTISSAYNIKGRRCNN